MAATIFTGIDALRMVIESETDANSPDNETTYAAMRVAIESLFLLAFSTGDTGTATSDPPDDTTGVLTDTGAAYDVDEHNGRTLLITSGTARGNFYTIDGGAATTLSCTDDNLYSDGVRSGDYYAILYDVKVNTDGHDHDGVNSKAFTIPALTVVEAMMANSAIAQAKLKTSTGSVSTASSENIELPGGEYGFYPQIYVSGGGAVSANLATSSYASSYTTLIYIDSLSSKTCYARQRYVTSSGEVHWIFILKDKSTGNIISMWEAPDHPCFGAGGDPLLNPHPFPGYDPGIHDIICINPSKEDVTAIKVEANTSKGVLKRGFLEVFKNDYEINEAVEPGYPDMEVTVGLPDNWEELPIGSNITPVKKKIPQPGYVKTAVLKKKAKQIGHD